MNVLGIIAEYNPFHNGHKYHLDTSVNLVNSDVVICVMSGNFVQRGEPAVIDKFSRANTAINNGIDIVIELPVYFANSTAETFAEASVSVLNNCGITHLSFGGETDNLDALSEISNLLINEPDSFKSTLKKSLEAGISFPKARALSVKSCYPEDSALIDTPNNILAVEYLKSIKKFNSNIIPVLIKRYKADYDSPVPVDEIASATAIRNMLKNNEDVSRFSCQNITKPIFIDDFEQLILYKLRSLSTESVANIPDVSEGLENRIIDACKVQNINELIAFIKSKRYTESRIKRILINMLLGITSEDFNFYKSNNYSQYLHVLACSNKGKAFLPNITKNSSIPIVTSVNKFLKSENYTRTNMLQKDIYATNIYNLISCRRYNEDYYNKLS